MEEVEELPSDGKGGTGVVREWRETVGAGDRE